MTEPAVAAEAHLRTLAPGVYAWIGKGGDSNAGAVETKDGLLVLDAQQNTALGTAFRDALRRETGWPVEKLVNTHYHMDHVAGNVVFAHEAPILAHEKTPEKLAELLGPANADGRWEVTETITRSAPSMAPTRST
jgi:cyclase